MRIIDRSEINDQKWNACILEAPVFRHYALTYFLDASTEVWKAIISDDYKWVWPIPIKKSIVGKVYQPLLSQQLGPFGIGISKKEFDECSALLKKNFWGSNIKYNEGVNADWLTDPIYHTNVDLDLSEPSESLEAGFNRNARTNIKKAKNSSLEILKKQSVTSQLITMFRQGRGSEINVLDDAFYEHVESIYNAFDSKGEAETWVALYKGEIVAGILLLTTNKRLLNFFTASNDLARKTGAMHFLMAAIFAEYAGGKYVFDFEGSNDKNLAYFYKSFGGEEKVYLQAYKKWNIPL